MRQRNYCTVEGCERCVNGRGLCKMHYARQSRNGSTADPVGASASERFESLVSKSETCWLWVGGADARGYGTFWQDGRNRPAHRVSYEMHVGPIPAGLQLDHLCRTPRCVRPDHLEPVTGRENVVRGTGFAAVNAAKTHCIHGHAFAGSNLHIDTEGKRRCNECRRVRVQWWRERKRTASDINGRI